MRRAAFLLACAALLGAAAQQGYRLPPEPEVALPKGPGAELVKAQCSACHSLDYIVNQPPNMGRAFWDAEVVKMRDVYGAEVDAESGERIAAYLAGESR